MEFGICMLALNTKSLQNTTEVNQNWPEKHIFQILNHLQGSIVGVLRHIRKDIQKKNNT